MIVAGDEENDEKAQALRRKIIKKCCRGQTKERTRERTARTPAGKLGERRATRNEKYSAKSCLAATRT